MFAALIFVISSLSSIALDNAMQAWLCIRAVYLFVWTNDPWVLLFVSKGIIAAWCIVIVQETISIIDILLFLIFMN